MSINEKSDLPRLEEIEEAVDKLLREIPSELKKIENLHDKIVPFRKEKLGGIDIHSKYAAGESVGGEFFDVIKKNHSALVILTSTDNYLASANAIAHVDALNNSKTLSKKTVADLLENLINDMKRKNLDPSKFELMSLFIDLRKKQVTGHNWGNYKILSTKQNLNVSSSLGIHDSAPPFSLDLERGERLLLLSPGMFKNMEECLEYPDIKPFLMETQDTKKLLNELFFHLKKDIEGDFLKYDSFAVVIEVNANALIQV